MTCDPFQLQAYLDGELAPAEEEKLRRHLAKCVSCRRELSALRLLWLELDRNEEVEAAPELPYLRHRVIAAVRERRPAKQKQPVSRNSALLWLNAQTVAWRPLLAGFQYIPLFHLMSRPARRSPDSPAARRGPRVIRLRRGRK
ncbi:MAG: anti-sigma factor [Alicyclobacillaceae bacterium]|nr:anti-sigma factor [Alicyclobacillaceae bacterium]